MQHVTLLAIGKLDQRNARRAIRIVLDLLHRGDDAELVPLEVDHAVLPLVSAATTPHGDVAVVVATARLLQRLGQRLLRRAARDLGEVGHGTETRPLRYWFE